jgi:signal transduction histidine kinase
MASTPPSPRRLMVTNPLRLRAWPLSAQVMLALAVALLPLGILAVVAAIDNYRNVRASEAELVSSRLTTFARTVQGRLDEDFALLRSAVLSDASSPAMRDSCARRLTRMVRVDPGIDSIVRYDASGGLSCASVGAPLTLPFNVAWHEAGRGRLPRATIIDETSPGRDLILAIRDPDTGDAIFGRLSRRSLGEMLAPADLRAEDHVRLLRDGRVLGAWGDARLPALPDIEAIPDGVLQRYETADGQTWLYGIKSLDIAGLRVLAVRRSTELTVPQAVTVALPVLMWLGAVLIGWLAIRWLVVQPLEQVRSSLDRYTTGDTNVRLGGGRFRTQEVRELGDAFDRMADQITRHEDDLRAGLATQKKLTREVHHRVKNNLQIVSSLLSLQSRDAASPEVAYAYATIQKRVNALALVHRWLYDDEAMRGVDLRSLAQDLCAGLEQSVTVPGGATITIAADVDRLYVGQDTAVPLAFLITELVTAAARLATGPGRSAPSRAKGGRRLPCRPTASVGPTCSPSAAAIRPRGSSRAWRARCAASWRMIRRREAIRSISRRRHRRRSPRRHSRRLAEVDLADLVAAGRRLGDVGFRNLPERCEAPRRGVPIGGVDRVDPDEPDIGRFRTLRQPGLGEGVPQLLLLGDIAHDMGAAVQRYVVAVVGIGERQIDGGAVLDLMRLGTVERGNEPQAARLAVDVAVHRTALEPVAVPGGQHRDTDVGNHVPQFRLGIAVVRHGLAPLFD